MRAAFISSLWLALAGPALAQSIFDGIGAPPSEEEQWEREISRQIRDHTPRRFNLGYGRPKVRFCVDPAGKVFKEVLMDSAAVDAHGLIALSVISSLQLPPQPPSVRAKSKGQCFWMTQSFYFH